ncbi:pep-cterm sorting domain-containing protein [Anaeramoeba ignava]|uniref:Pep-cterm sorting domain-containing protein n=1 Tax=Anaeramoeba ignava TaxID=1746090 RepID=A0A9Q0L6I4_ANAIG|nr:pep-cterm sorting domain-containing protein [Anaeramoeba ignava]
MDNNNDQIENANQNQNENEMKNLEKKVTKNLIKDYSNLLNGNSFKDFSIFVENKSNPFEIKVHKSILCSRSPFFNEFLKGQNDLNKISLNQFNKKEMESILSYIYYGNISFENQENLIQLLEISIYFKLNLLKEIIQKKISNSINYSNFFQFLFQNRNLNSNEIEIKFDIQNKVIQDNQKKLIQEKEKKIQEKEKKIKRRDKRIKSFESDIRNLKSENKKKEKEIEEKWKKEVEDMKPIFDKYRDQYQKDLEYEKKMKELEKAFSDSEIVQDIEYVNKLQEWINDNDFFSKMKKGFSAKKDGFNSQNWHKAVDGKGKTLVIIKTKQNFIFGGFTQVGFNGNTGGIIDSNAFIFSLRNDKGDRIPAKFTIKQPQYAIYSNLNYGPTFGDGGYDFCLSYNLQPGLSNFGYSYNPPNGITYGTNEAKSYLAGSYSSWVVDELETYFI